MKRFTFLTLSSTALCTIAGLAGAATVSETDAFSIDTTTGPGAPSSVSLSFAQFNASLGTLTGVSVELTGSANSVLEFVNNYPSAIAFTNGTSSTALSLSGTGLATQTSPTLNSSVASGTMNGSSASPAVAYTYFSGGSSAVSLLGAIASGSWGAYTGSGTETLNAGFGTSTSSGSFSTPAGYIAGVGGGGQASGDVIVTYSYTPVPLPAAAWLLLSGVAGLSARARRRKTAQG